MGSSIGSDRQAWMRRRREIIRLAHGGHDVPAFLGQIAQVLRKSIPYEAGCWHALDPATLIETTYGAINLPLENPLAAEIEYLHDDYNQFAALARSPRHSGILSAATEGVPERSRRYREIIRPFGLHGELRTTFVSGGNAWGSICLLRDRHARDFVPEEVSFLEAVSAHVGRGIHAALMLQQASANPAHEEGPGLILLDLHQRLDSMTPAAERLLHELADGERDARELPYVVYAVATKARRAGRVDSAEAPACAHVRTRSGKWLALHGCHLEREQARIAVIVECAKPYRVGPGLADVLGLTAREGEVMQHLLHGLSTKQIASRLGISPYTVQEHCTAIFDKADVRSRRELVGKVFRQLYEPAIRAQRAGMPGGSFATSPRARTKAN